jgi:hypothetical protein
VGDWTPQLACVDLRSEVGIGRRAMPEGEPMELRLPETDKGPVDLRLHRTGELSPSGTHGYLQPASGVV